MNLLLLFASQPLYGQVLPGLVPPLHPFQAALLYHAFLRDQLRILASMPECQVRICFAPGLLPGSFEGDLQWEIQRGETQEERLSSAFQSAFKSGAAKVLALGYENQLQPREAMDEALAGLDSKSVVIGQGMVGFRRFLPSMLKVQPHQYRGMAVAYSLKYQMIPGAFSFENYGDLSFDLKKNPDLAPLCATTLAAIS